MVSQQTWWIVTKRKYVVYGCVVMCECGSVFKIPACAHLQVILSVSTDVVVIKTGLFCLILFLQKLSLCY